MTKILRLVVVLAVSLAALLATTSLASAAPAPKLTPKQQQTLCIAKKAVELLKAVDKQTWKDKKAREAAVKAIPAKAKAACPLGETPPTPTDVCLNIEGNQATIPTGTYDDGSGNCVPTTYPETVSVVVLPGESGQLRFRCDNDNNDRRLSQTLSGDTSIVTSVDDSDDQVYRVNYTNNTGQSATLTVSGVCFDGNGPPI